MKINEVITEAVSDTLAQTIRQAAGQKGSSYYVKPTATSTQKAKTGSVVKLEPGRIGGLLSKIPGLSAMVKKGGTWTKTSDGWENDQGDLADPELAMALDKKFVNDLKKPAQATTATPSTTTATPSTKGFPGGLWPLPPEFEIKSLNVDDPIITYKNRDYGLNNQGEWGRLGAGANVTIQPALSRVLDRIAFGKVMGESK